MIYLLPQPILAGGKQYPEREAFRCGANRLTYGELSTKIRQLAGVLNERGIGRGDRVGILMNRCLETAIAVHGIMLAGAVYVPLNPRNPTEELAFQLRDCDIRLLVVNPAVNRTIKGLITEDTPLKTVIGWRTDQPPERLNTISWEAVFTASATPPSVNVLGDDPAYIMYTSGSTGRPKGMVHTHRSGLSFARLAAAELDAGPADRIANHAPLYFDISTLAYFVAPLVGATACLTTDAHTLFPASLAPWIEAEGITVWYSVPLALVQLLSGRHLSGKDLSRLRHLIYAGEPCAPKYLREIMELAPGLSVTNWYGPAETNVCTSYRIPGPPEGDDAIPIGRICRDAEYRLLDEAGRTVTPPGEGILYVRSATQMAGYWRRPELNAASHLSFPGEDGVERRFYRTGDWVFEDETGLLHFRGRKDNQVKVRGYRIELAAVEAALVSHPSVAEAVVLAPVDEAGVRSLTAYFVPSETTPPPELELRTWLASRLPPYALPSAFAPRDDFPRTGSGKIDKNAIS